MKKFASLLVLLLMMVAAPAQKKSVIPIEKGERWWGAATSMGSDMPLDKPTELKALSENNYQGQVVPFLVSSYGRYIWSDKLFDFTFDGSQFIIDGPEEVEAQKIAKTLREAYVLAHNKHFKGSGKTPDAAFFNNPIYNTCLDFMQSPNQNGIEQYASDVISNGFPAGIIVIDQCWQKYNGNFDFQPDKFPDPKALTDRLHDQGFKVMLWVSPFVSADSPEFRDLQKRGLLIKEKSSSRAAIIRWWNGASACFDLTNPASVDYLASKLKELQTKYGIDGFKFDAGDFNYYDTDTQDYFAKDALPAEQTHKWAELGLMFPLNEYRACSGMQGEALVQKMADKEHSWDGLSTLVPEMINAGLMGYAYTCPDKIGGRMAEDYATVDFSGIDQDLMVRFAQLHAMMPIMQFSVGPWRVLDQQHLAYCLDAVKIREKFAPYIAELAEASAKTGEPIVRHLEYMFPAKGFSDCSDQFMLGSKYLVAPVVTADGKRTVRLPNGTWVDDKDARHKGPLVLNIQAEPGRLPYYEYKGVIKDPKTLSSTSKKRR